MDNDTIKLKALEGQLAVEEKMQVLSKELVELLEFYQKTYVLDEETTVYVDNLLEAINHE